MQSVDTLVYCQCSHYGIMQSVDTLVYCQCSHNGILVGRNIFQRFIVLLVICAAKIN